MEYVFQRCSSLETLDLSSFDTSQVTDFHYMFYGCNSLKYLDLSNFKTSSCICTFNMFENCTSITSINLSSFDTSKVTLMSNMFYNCKNLISLDLSSFDTTSVTHIQFMFSGCEKLEFVNFKIATISTINLKEYNNMITNTAKNIVFCVDESKTSILNQQMDQNICSIRISDCSNWRKYQKKILPDSNECVDSCLNTSYPFEYLGKCYDKCPKGTFNNNYICYDHIELENNPWITAIEFKNYIKDSIYSYANSSKVINGSNFLAIISTSDEINPEEQLKNGISSFDLGNCTNVLKEYYGIPNEENLIILNMEIINKNESYNNNDKSFNLGKNTQLEIFDITGRKLNLTVCKEDIKIFKYIGDVKELDINSAQFLSNQGIDVFNAADDFFNDICHQYENSSENRDIILNDRRNDIYQNVSFCQYGCIYKGINYSLMAANCICDSIFLEKIYDDTVSEDTEPISFKDIKNIFLANLFSFNFEVLRCHNLVFNKKIIVTNIGFYCLLSMLFLQIIFFIIYMIKKLKLLKHYLLKLNSHKSNDDENKNSIYIINKKGNKKIDSKNNNKKIKSTPPPKNKNKFKSKNKYKLNKNKNLIINKSKRNSSKSVIISNNSEDINIKNPIIFRKNYLKGKENLIRSKNDEKYKIIKSNINSIYEMKSNKNEFFKKYNSKSKCNEKELIGKKKDEFKFINKKKDKKKLFQDIYNLQDMDYEEAVIYDKRGYLRMYLGFLVDTQIILGTFCTDNHLDLFVIKLSFFIFTFQISFFLNALFYTDEYISNAYHNNGVLDFISGLPKSIYSYIATLITTNLLRMLSNSKNELIRLIKGNIMFKTYLYLIHVKLAKLRKKLIIYFTLVFLLTLFFLYYVSAFCAVYKYSQKYWFFGCIESFGMDALVSILICFFLALFRFISIQNHIKCLYITSNIISTFL